MSLIDPSSDIEFNLNNRQMKMVKLYRQAYKKVVLIRHKNKWRVINPEDVVVFET